MTSKHTPNFMISSNVVHNLTIPNLPKHSLTREIGEGEFQVNGTRMDFNPKTERE